MASIDPAYQDGISWFKITEITCPCWIFSPGVILLLFGSVFFVTFKYVRGGERYRALPKFSDIGMVDALERKGEFLRRTVGVYGYPNSAVEDFDEWRERELPGLIPSITLGRKPDRKCRKKSEAIVYLDYAGAALPIKSQLDAIRDDTLRNIRGNPHSSGPAASRTALRIKDAKTKLLSFFDGHTGRYYGTNHSPDNVHTCQRDWHPGYELVFTRNATDALLRLAENFDWSESSVLVYPQQAHTSVLGVRQLALQNGAQFLCKPAAELLSDVKNGKVSEWSNSDGCNNLLIWPAECNFGGDKFDLDIVEGVRRKGWHVFLDLAKYASTNPVSLVKLNPDFACVSLYKIVGVPTGLGCLLVKRNSMGALVPSTGRYFGGGSVDVVLSKSNFVVPRSIPSVLASWDRGTVHFDGICQVVHGLDAIGMMGGMPAIQAHSSCLAKEFVRRMDSLRHDNDANVIEVYGAWAIGHEHAGPTIAFNVKRRDGSYVGYNQVSKLAELNHPPIQFRSGCFCNPGACQLALGFEDEDIRRHYKVAGKVCGDQNEIIDGRPTGAIRVSFGKDSSWEDMDTMLIFLERLFVAKEESPHIEPSVGWNSGPRTATLKEIHIFPIKSCAAMTVSEWSFDKNLRPLWDREFALVDTSGSAMRLVQYPMLAHLRPTIDLKQRTLKLSAPGKNDLEISLEAETPYPSDVQSNVVRVCGAKCGALLWGSVEASDWLTDYVGTPCWLARHASVKKSHAFANEQPVLLISKNAVDTLNDVLVGRGQSKVSSKHFRPNLVVEMDVISTKNENLEDSWSCIQTESGTNFDVVGPCARCSMVDIDPTSGSKNSQTLRALAEYRRHHGQITFGIFLRGKSEKLVVLRKGDLLFCK